MKLTLARPAQLVFTFERKVRRRFKRVGGARKSGRAGANTFRFKKAGRKRFTRGSWRMTIVPVEDGRRGPRLTVSFSVRR